MKTLKMAPRSNRCQDMAPEKYKNGQECEVLHHSEMMFSSIRHDKVHKQAPVYRFTWLDMFVVLVSMGTYLADIVTDILVMLVYWKINEPSWAGLTLTFLIVPAVVMQVFSTRWYMADGHKMSVGILVIHLLMMGPMKRYVNVLIHGFRARRTKRIEDYQLMYSELSDVSMLRLFECFLESAPQLILQLYIMIRVEEGDHILTGISACFSLMSLSWTIVAYNKALRAAVSKRNRVSWSGMFLQTLWRVGMVAARIIAIVLFATIFQEWILLILGIHWLLMTGWVVFQDTDFCNSWWEERLFNAVIGFIYIFCFFNMKEGRSRRRAVIYYTVVFTENTVMALLWWPQRTTGTWYNVPAFITVWGGFLIGITSMILYYKYFHPASEQHCHCCLAWYRTEVACRSAFCCFPSHHHNMTMKSTPYRKSHNSSGSNAFETTESSEEELDYRDFTDLRCSYETPTTADPSYMPPKAAICNKHKLNPHHRHLFGHSSTSKQCGMAVAVVGNAHSGYKVQSFKPGQEQLVKTGTLNRVVMPRPRATSTPGDDLNLKHSHRNENEVIPECRESSNSSESSSVFEEQRDCFDVAADTPRTKLAKMCPTPKTHKPGSPSTLVRNWVRDNQNMYAEGRGCFSASFKGDVTPVCHDKPECRVTIDHATEEHQNDKAKQRKNPLRMKSFSKKARLRGNKRPRHNRSMRESFREAFGFHVIDLDAVSRNNGDQDWKESELLGLADEAKPKHKAKTQKKPKNCNAIKSRRDEPPVIVDPPLKYKCSVQRPAEYTKPMQAVKDEESIPYYDATDLEEQSDVGFTTAIQSSMYDNMVKKNDDEKSQTKQETEKENLDVNNVEDHKENIYQPSFSMDRVEYLRKFGKSAFNSNSKDSPARKKLAFKPGSNVLKPQNRSNNREDVKMNRSVEPLGKSMEGVLDSGENYRIHLKEKSSKSPLRKPLIVVSNKTNLR